MIVQNIHEKLRAPEAAARRGFMENHARNLPIQG
jgi:hypothetical protein